VRIVVCIKEIQNPEAPALRIDDARSDILPLDGLQVTSPFDEQAIEAALRLRDHGAQCRITVVTFGPAEAAKAIKRALSMGADDGIHVSNAGAERADSIATAHILAHTLRNTGAFDLILAGRQAADWDAGIVGCGLAELLGLPIVTFAKSVQLENGHVVVERVLDDGFETVVAPLPCVVTISNELGEPRKASLRETMRAAKKPTQTLDLEAIGAANAAPVPTQRRERLFVPQKTGTCEFAQGASADEMAQQIVARLAASRLL
jgi:electron transfer flavoprotein beta subunit